MNIEELKEKNKKLIEEYPFLLPRNIFTDEVVIDYDYEYTLLDNMPDGWRIAFGDDLLRELKEELVKSGMLDKYRVNQIKEKYGELRWYDNYNTKKGYEIIDKYSKLSGKICIECGKPAKYLTTGWISPYCEDCVKENQQYLQQIISILDSEND